MTISFMRSLSRRVFHKRSGADEVFELHQTIMAPTEAHQAKSSLSQTHLSVPIQQDSRRADRQQRRQMLYGVVRDVMVRAEVLSISYKFKVLSLDAGGRQYLVMMDVMHAMSNQNEWLEDMEAQIIRSARKLHDIHVKAVYWRVKQPVLVDR